MPRALAFWVLLRPPHAWVTHGCPVPGHQLDSLSKTPGARLKHSLPPAPAAAVGSLADAAPGTWLRGAWCAPVSQSLAQTSRKQAGRVSTVPRQATGSASLPLSWGGGGAAQGGAGARGVGEPGQGRQGLGTPHYELDPHATLARVAPVHPIMVIDVPRATSV